MDTFNPLKPIKFLPRFLDKFVEWKNRKIYETDLKN